MNRRLPTNKRRFIGFISGWDKRIIETAELAQVSHDADTLVRIASAGLGPVSTFCEAIGLNRQGRMVEAERLASQLIEHGPSGFKAKAMIILAGNRRLPDPDTAMALCERARIYVDDPGTALTIIKLKAVVLSAAFGDHQRALTTLEEGVPLLRQLPRNPPLRIDYLNSLAVEHTNLGLFDQAHQLCNIITASPWLPRFPGWMETAQTLGEADPRGRAMTTVPRKKATLLRFTAAVRESPAQTTRNFRADAFEAVSHISDPRILNCIAQLGSLTGPNLELAMRVQDVSNDLATALLHQIDHFDKYGVTEDLEECTSPA